MEHYYHKEYSLAYTHVDCHGRIRPSVMFEIMQDAATAHAHELGLAREQIGVLWVLSRLRVQLDRPLYAGTLSLTTWCAGLKGAAWLRAFRFEMNGEDIGGALSTWVVLDAETHRMLRPKMIGLAPDHPALLPGDQTPPDKLRLCPVAPHHVHTVRYTDMDVNNHLNNARIVDLISDALDLQTHRNEYVQSIQVNYTAESVAGDELTLSVGEADGAFCVRGSAADAVRFEAMVTLAPVSQ